MSQGRVRILVLTMSVLAVSAGLFLGGCRQGRGGKSRPPSRRSWRSMAIPHMASILAASARPATAAARRLRAIPQINGIGEHHFVRAMIEYREKIRTNEVMRTTAARLSDEEIAALAAHFTEREQR